ncbi:MAG: RNA-binding protein [Bacteroidetes bacterium]|nr:RNA-binding protein [Bacteroidota bacterium]
MRIFVGNIGTDISAGDLFSLFSGYGSVDMAHVPVDPLGNPRGFGYVSMPAESDGHRAIDALNKKPFMDQFLVVNEAIDNREQALEAETLQSDK